ncbi:MAG: hypothetical protein HC859_08930 [Bacteroidia bacterium]|nr:hypothetical protein [Bacteroidia bacterium]
MKLAVTGDIYTKGGHAVNISSNYSKRYKYTGNLRFNYSRTRTSDQIENPQTASDFSLGWSHSPQSKGSSRFSASVNAATSTYNQNNNLIYGYSNSINSSSFSNITTKLSSNVSYNKKFVGTPFTMALNMSHNQDLVSRLVDLSLPTLTLNMTNLYPFQRKGKTGPLDNFVIGYSMAGSNRITNNIGRVTTTATRDSIAPFTTDNLSLFFKNARNGIRHSIPVSYSFRILKYFTVSPSVSYEEKWYFKRLNWQYVKVDDSYRFVSTEEKGFNRIANYSTSASMTTRLYGTYLFKRGNVKAIRHIINPSVSIGYTPDFTINDKYFQEFTDVNNNVVLKSRHEGFVYGSSTTGKSGSIGFGLGNNLEMKVKTARDTAERKVMLLNNFSINSSYNLVADSFKLAPFSLAANTNVLDNTFNVNVSASLDPYRYLTTVDEEGTATERRIDEYAWKGGGIGRITSATLAVSTNLNPKGRSQEQSTREKVAGSNLPDEAKQEIIRDPSAYVDFDIPWGLRINYSLSYSHTLNADPKVTQSIQMSGDLSLSEQWKITANSGYHFESKEFTQTDLGISRDLHCWTMRLYWVPFGRFQSYNFTIAVKASMLQDLKLERRKPFFDNL